MNLSRSEAHHAKQYEFGNGGRYRMDIAAASKRYKREE